MSKDRKSMGYATKFHIWKDMKRAWYFTRRILDFIFLYYLGEFPLDFLKMPENVGKHNFFLLSKCLANILVWGDCQNTHMPSLPSHFLSPLDVKKPFSFISVLTDVSRIFNTTKQCKSVHHQGATHISTDISTPNPSNLIYIFLDLKRTLNLLQCEEITQH